MISSLVVAVVAAGVGPVPITGVLALDPKTETVLESESVAVSQVVDRWLETSWPATGKRLVLSFETAEVVAVELRVAKDVHFTARIRGWVSGADGGVAPIAQWQTSKELSGKSVVIDLPKPARWSGVEIEVAAKEGVKVEIASVFVQASKAPHCPKGHAFTPVRSVLSYSVNVPSSFPEAVNAEECSMRIAGVETRCSCRWDESLTLLQLGEVRLIGQELGCGLAVFGERVWRTDK